MVGYSVHQRPGDTSCMKDHLEELKTLLHGELPKNIIAMPAMAAKKITTICRRKKLVSYVKYNTFHKKPVRNGKKT